LIRGRGKNRKEGVNAPLRFPIYVSKEREKIFQRGASLLSYLHSPILRVF